MNNNWLFIPICMAVVSSIVLLALEMSWFNVMEGAWNIIVWSIFWTSILAYYIYKKYKKEIDGENLYTLVGSSILFGFVVIMAYSSFFNRVYATNGCEFTSYEVLGYEGRFASGYGNVKKGKRLANQWVLSIMKERKKQDFVLNRNIFKDKPVTSTIELKFCRGMLDTEYLNLENK